MVKWKESDLKGDTLYALYNDKIKKKMKEVLDTTIENGGATSASDTIYQIIAVPKELNLWLKAPNNFDWQEGDLKRLFSPS